MVRSLVFVPLLVACSASQEAVWGSDSWSEGEMLTGRLTGTLDDVRRFDDELSRGYSSVGPDYAHVEMHVVGEYGWAMIGVDLWGRAPLADGTYRMAAFDGDEEGGSVIGCSGPDDGQAAFDMPAEEAEVTVSTDPETGEIVVEVTADFGNDGSVSGTATLPPDVRNY